MRTRADASRLHYLPLRHFRPELPAWVDAVLHKALHPDPAKRQQAASEFVQDLKAPGQEFVSPRRAALIERNPVRFWQGTTVLLAALSVVLLGALVLGR